MWILRYRLQRTIGRPKTLPINVTVSITNKCNSRCRTCYIWEFYPKHHDQAVDELNLDEYEKIFRSLGRQVIWATISGGEPYLRLDIVEIIRALNDICKPAVINIPTNALLPETVKDRTKELLEACPRTTVVVNVSLDGVGAKHDKLRGVRGNFEKVLTTFCYLKELRSEFPRLHVGAHSVVSRESIDSLLEVYDYTKQLGVDSYITEVAEHRTELFNLERDITPSAETYHNFIAELSKRIEDDYLHSTSFITKLTQALRLEYYRIASKVLLENRQIIPCYAGYASCQITPFGDVWPCCILGYDMVMGNLRESEYNFSKIWFSDRAEEIRRHIRLGKCYCPLANAHYTSMLCSFNTMLKVLGNMVC